MGFGRPKKGAAAIALSLLDAWNARDLPRFINLLTGEVEWYDPAMPQPRDIRGSQVARIYTAFDVITATEQLLGISLRPQPGTLRERLLVRAQRIAAAWFRRRSVRPAD